jgi:gliding motility-associated-like protein
MNKFLPILLICFLSLLGFQRAHASHLMGANLTYECQPDGSYKVTLKLYRDCGGVDAGSAASVAYSSAQCGVTGSFVVDLIPGYPIDITPTCPGQKSKCSGGSLGYGVQEYIYQGILTLPAGCGTDWILGWNTCCRNAAITTLNGPDNQDMAVATTINNTLSPCNSSPEFLNPPVPFTCVNQPVFFNPGGVDIDGDSLAFSFATPQQAAGPVVYKGSYNVNNPLTTAGGITINPVTGDVNFTPTQVQVGVLAVQVKEYRNGQLISTIVRDIQYTILNCSNKNPTATGMNGTGNYTTTVYAGEQACFTVNSADQDAGNAVTMDWNQAIPGATFTAAGSPYPTGSFCWQTTPLDTGIKTFTITVEDNNCPITGSNTYSYTINVLPCPNPPIVAGPDVDLCPGQTTTLSATTTGLPANIQSVEWSDGTTTHAGYTWAVNPTASTVYTITLRYKDGCVKTDQVLVNRSKKPTISVFPANATVCAGGSIQLAAYTTGAARLKWFPSAGLSCDTCAITIASPSVSTVYKAVAYNSSGCPSDTATSNITASPPPPPQSCAVIYATPAGTGDGSQASPTNLKGAIAKAQCNNGLIRLAQGVYLIDSAITNITSYTTIEGGYNPATWVKSSTPGLTTIRRSAANPEGPANARRIVAFYFNSSAYFRFQDITFETADCPATITGEGMSNYVFHMTNCNDYKFVRCVINPGRAGNGIAGIDASGNGAGGANATGKNGAAGIAAGGDGGAGGTSSFGGGPTTGEKGTAGVGSPNTCGGAGGAFSGFPPSCHNGTIGADGTAGTPGAAGTTNPYTFSSGFFIPGLPGGNGPAGGNGGGGCGGGGGSANIIDDGGAGGGGGAGGMGGPGGTGGTGAGSSFGVFLYNNGANGVFTQTNIAAPVAGIGGVGGKGSTGGNGGNGAAGVNGDACDGAKGGNGGKGGDGGAGGSGANGLGARIYVNGGSPLSAPVDSTFGLAAQPTITVDNVNCTFRTVTYTTPSPAAWTLGTGAVPPTGNGSPVTTQYNTFGRKDINLGANLYAGFGYIAIDANSYIPNISTSATRFNGDTFIICQGAVADFEAVIPGADTFDWNFGGAIIPNTYVGTQYQDITNKQFNTIGTFKIKVRVSTSCCGPSPYDSIYIIVEPQPVLAITGRLAFCPGDSVTLTASGADSYEWSPAAGLSSTTSNVVVAKPANSSTYLLTGYSPNKFCTADTVLDITLKAPPVLTVTTVPAECGPVGTITVTPTLPGDYSFAWAAPITSTDSVVTGLSIGGYQVTVTDISAGCTATGGGTVGPGNGIQAFVDSTASPKCFGICSGVARVRGLPAGGNFTYLWSNGQTTATATNLCADTFSVTVTNAAGCSASTRTTVTQPADLSVDILDTTDLLCFGTRTGSARADGVGGVGPYAYLWNDPLLQDSNVAINLAAGTYKVYVIDRNNCADSAIVTIASPPQLLADTLVVNDASCLGGDGSIVLTVTGGTYPYQYAWPQIPGNIDSFANNLTGNTYTAYVVDANNCADTVTALVNESLPLNPSVLNVDSVSCFGGSDGLITVALTGGNRPYEFSINNGTSYQADSTFTGLVIGPYTILLRDALGCDTFITATIAQPTQLVFNVVSVDSANCFGSCDGGVVLSASGGIAPYRYSNAGGVLQQSPSFTALCAAVQSFTLTDTNGCTATVSATVEQPSQVVLVQTANTPSSCFGRRDGSATLSASGGTGTFQYSLDNGPFRNTGFFDSVQGGLPHTGIVRDVNGCSDTIPVTVPSPPQTTFLDTTVTNVTCFGLSNGAVDLIVTGSAGPWTYLWSTGETTEDISSKPAGCYNVTVTDAAGCTGVGLDTICIKEPAILVLTIAADSVKCNGASDGCATVTPVGGTPAYSYAWSAGGSTADKNCNIPAGAYTVTVTDANGCTETISAAVEQPPLLTIAPVPSPATCIGFSDGTIDAAPAGGTQPYTYAWSPVSGSSQVLTGLPTGLYNLTVTDRNSCTATQAGIFVDELPGIELFGVVKNVLCPPLKNGFIDLTQVGGVGNVKFEWSDNTFSEDQIGIDAGTYSVTVTDSRNCTSDTTFTVLNDSIFKIVATPADTSIVLGGNVPIRVTNSPGTQVSSFFYRPAQNLSCINCPDPVANPVNSTLYIIEATDTNGCQYTDTVNIAVIPEYPVFVPNLFSPGGDGRNDFFEIFGNKEAWKQMEMQLFDRWGERVYQTTDRDFKWDGTFNGKYVQPGVYVYILNITWVNNHTNNTYKGSVTIIR